jgi:hypothetical protein
MQVNYIRSEENINNNLTSPSGKETSSYSGKSVYFVCLRQVKEKGPN